MRAGLSALVLALASCGPPHAMTFGGGAALTVHHAGLYPETIEYDDRRARFLIGSFREGAIYAIDDRGEARRVIDDPGLCSVLGIAIDRTRDRLWAVSSDLGASVKPSRAGAKQMAQVAVYDLATGGALRTVDLAPLAPGPHLLNGIALDGDGNAYVTDSFAPVLYRIAADGEARVFLRSEQFTGAGVNLNGVVVHPDGYLLVVKKSDGGLFKVPLGEPAHFTQVKLATPLIGGDGLTLLGKRDLVVIANRTPATATNAAIALSSADGWATARVESTLPLGDVYPTTATVRRGTLYAIHSRLDELLDAAPARKAEVHREATIQPLGRVRAIE
jgi:hypothetical protein